MDFGRLSQVDHIRFEIPPTAERSLKLLRQSSGSANDFKAYVGLPLWANKDWVGQLYPRGTPPKDYLYIYSHQFNSVELNTTHYATPDVGTLESWRSYSPEDFKFCPKFPQEISHLRLLRHCGTLARDFCARLWQLGRGRLGLFFLQLPPFFPPADLEVLRAFLVSLPREIPLAVEFRHPQFYVKNQLIPEAADLLEEFGISSVITDTAGRRDVLHTTLSSPYLFLRFLTNSLHPSDVSRIEDWARRIAEWKNEGLKEVYFFVHEPRKALQLEVAGLVIEALNQYCGLQLKNWQPAASGEDPTLAQLNLFS